MFTSRVSNYPEKDCFIQAKRESAAAELNGELRQWVAATKAKSARSRGRLGQSVTFTRQSAVCVTGWHLTCYTDAAEAQGH